uniref:Uncharacterized protein n=1 Tax=Avena sativa TaxID=4498 RepID=A0ACD6A2R0_AVESA
MTLRATAIRVGPTDTSTEEHGRHKTTPLEIHPHQQETHPTTDKPTVFHTVPLVSGKVSHDPTAINTNGPSRTRISSSSDTRPTKLQGLRPSQETAHANAAMAATLDPPTKARKLAPPMSWRTRLSIFAAGYLTDATCRGDGTINRRLLTYLDPGVPASAAPRNGVASRDIDVDPAIPLRARFFHPVGGGQPAGPLPVVVFFHGGGFAYLSASSLAYDAACRRIARYCGAAVLSVEYRRSPEHRFPAAYDDGFAALRFLDDPKKHPSGSDVPPLDVSRCFLTGDSAGANIAHHVARRYALSSASFATVRVAGLIAIQPFFGGEERTPAELRLEGAPIVSISRCDWMWRAFLPHGADRTHEAAHAASPAALAGIDSPAFPPAVVVVGGYDPLQDWQRRYCDTLRSKGKEVRVLEYPDAIHAFYVFPEFAESKDLMLRIKELVGGTK